ncbi:hypothetical protein BST22_09990 [Mycolicibacterium chubuense]|uniref:Uncharacterized protein n=1 Tax=Mycolicibacterium chubuense TaxID=1800 RepID=A0A0J6WA26_MYCCU|nr:hypothetical protein MCHUDSM44219_03005 [Mycolicibacterium chubuense]ORA53461.1 hypothetical protein BST22_09990 [Mycolicibacterium chubuense]SPX96338.1 Uncharacterised protein [Mycolicibacterium chubuense]
MTEFTEYCKNCGHPKEHHDLDAEFDPKMAREERAKPGQSACSDMSFDDHHCICTGYQSWT